jgi:hypothetical protein
MGGSILYIVLGLPRPLIYLHGIGVTKRAKLHAYFTSQLQLSLWMARRSAFSGGCWITLAGKHVPALTKWIAVAFGTIFEVVLRSRYLMTACSK